MSYCQRKEIYGEWFTSQQGLSAGTTRMWDDDPAWKVDPLRERRSAEHC